MSFVIHFLDSVLATRMRSTAQTPSTSKAPYTHMLPWGEVQIDDSSDGPEEVESEVTDGEEERGSSDDDDYSMVITLSV